MTLPYENQLIGAFLYAVGYASGQRANAGSAAPLPINLLQQTPLDRTFSDLVLGRERAFVLEFKRSQQEVAGEREKWDPDRLAQFRANQRIQALSAKGHLVVYGKPQPEGIALRLCCYLDALGLASPVKLNRGSAQKLVETLYPTSPSEPFDFGLAPRDLLSYLDALRELRRKRTSIGGRATTESAWLAVSQSKDGFHYHVADSLERFLELDRSAEPTLTHEPERESPGMDLGR